MCDEMDAFESCTQCRTSRSLTEDGFGMTTQRLVRGGPEFTKPAPFEQRRVRHPEKQRLTDPLHVGQATRATYL